MSMDFSLKITSNVDEIIQQKDEALIKAFEDIGLSAEAFAVGEVDKQVYRSPQGSYIRTGALRNSITHRSDGKSAVIGSNLEYAPYVEYGTGVYAESGGRSTPWIYQDDEGNWHRTVGMKPRHFLKDAIEKHLPEFQRILELYLSGQL